MPIAPTPVPNITTPVPLSTDPNNFDPRADQAWTDLVESIGAMNEENEKAYQNNLEAYEAVSSISAAALVAANAAGFVGKSNSPLTVGAGVKNVTLLAAKPELVELNRRVYLVNRSDPSIKMVGTISSVTSTTVFSVTVVSSGAVGSGSYSNWHVIDASFFGTAATKEVLWDGSDDASVVTAKAFVDAGKPVPVAYASTVTLNMKAGIGFSIDPLTGNIVLANPTGLADKIGQTGSIDLTQDATGGRLISYGTYWKPVGGSHLALTSAANAKDTLYYEIKSATRIEYQMGRNFTA